MNVGSWLAVLGRRRSFTATELGRAGEDRAARYYRLRGYSILARNVRRGRGEIDLVVRRHRTIAFVEVKTRHGSGKGAPHEAVDRDKQLQVVKIAGELIREHNLGSHNVRFDIMSVLWDGRRFHLECYTDAYRPVGEPGLPWRWS